MSLTYLASEKVVPGYGGGMSSAKAQLESDTKVVDPPALREAPLPLTLLLTLSSSAGSSCRHPLIPYLDTDSCTCLEVDAAVILDGI